MATDWKPIGDSLEAADPKKFVASFAALHHPFWDGHYTLAAAPLRRPIALVGSQRIDDLLLNIFYPVASLRSADIWAEYLTRDGPPPAAAMRVSARAFFGHSDRAFLRTAVHQQGLLQMQRDLDDSPDPTALLDTWRHAA